MILKGAKYKDLLSGDVTLTTYAIQMTVLIMASVRKLKELLVKLFKECKKK